MFILFYSQAKVEDLQNTEGKNDIGKLVVDARKFKTQVFSVHTVSQCLFYKACTSFHFTYLRRVALQ